MSDGGAGKRIGVCEGIWGKVARKIQGEERGSYKFWVYVMYLHKMDFRNKIVKCLVLLKHPACGFCVNKTILSYNLSV